MESIAPGKGQLVFHLKRDSVSQSVRKYLWNVNLSNIQHENVGEWLEFLWQIPFVDIAIEKHTTSLRCTYYFDVKISSERDYPSKSGSHSELCNKEDLKSI